MTEPSLDAFLRALDRNTQASVDLKASVDRLADEFQKLRAQAPPVPPETPADRVAEVAGDAIQNVLSEMLGGKKKRRR